MKWVVVGDGAFDRTERLEGRCRSEIPSFIDYRRLVRGEVKFQLHRQKTEKLSMESLAK